MVTIRVAVFEACQRDQAAQAHAPMTCSPPRRRSPRADDVFCVGPCMPYRMGPLSGAYYYSTGRSVYRLGWRRCTSGAAVDR